MSDLRLVTLGGPVTRPGVREIIKQLRELDRKSSSDIQLVLVTPGGDVSAGLALIDVIQGLRSDVMTVGFGMIASAGAGIISAGTKGKRFMGPNAYLMTHQPRGVTPNHVGSVESMIDYKYVWAETIARNTNNTVGQVEAWNDRDKYMHAEEALENGFIDGVLEHSFDL